MGLHTLRLDTNRSLAEARALYLRNGYREVAPYNDNHYADHWFQKDGITARQGEKAVRTHGRLKQGAPGTRHRTDRYAYCGAVRNDRTRGLRGASARCPSSVASVAYGYPPSTGTPSTGFTRHLQRVP